jgi:hypothetical protein
MEEFHTQEVSSDKFEVPATPVPGGNNSLELSLSHWVGEPLDIDLEVSVDGGVTWAYGGGGKGVVSSENGIRFSFTYPIHPTHVRGSFRSDQIVTSLLKMTVVN